MAVKLGLGTQLRALMTKLDGDVQTIYDEAGLPFRPRFFPIVQHLLGHGPATVTALARAIGVSQPAATQTLREMAKLGLVDGQAGADARERLIGLSDRGAELADQLTPIWNAVREAAEELDRQLPHPLSQTVQSALAALDNEPFRERIRRRLDLA